MRIDAVVVASDVPREVQRSAPGELDRDPTRLTVGGALATIDFLGQYLRNGRDAARAAEAVKQARRRLLPVPLSGPYLQQFLERRGLRAQLIPFFTPGREALAAHLGERPRAVVISTTFLSLPTIEEIARFAKERSPETLVVAGGIKPWKSYCKRLLAERGEIDPEVLERVAADNYLVDPARPSAVDALVVSERGEATLAELLGALAAGERPTGMANTAWREPGGWRLNPLAPERYLPGEEEIRVDWSRVPALATAGDIPVSSGRGCRFRCRFCDFQGLHALHERPLDSVVAELRTVPVVDGVRRVFFTDDSLFTTPHRTRRFCQALVDADLHLRWKAFVRADAVDEETAELMWRSGCRESIFGVESGDPTVLRNMRKGLSPEKVLRAVGLFNAHGMHTQSTFIVGYPGETAASLRSTVDLLNAYPTGGPGLHFFYPFLFLVTPLAPVASRASRQRLGLRGYLNDWSHSTMDSRTASRAILELCDGVKPEVSPIYFENRRDLSFPADAQKRVFLVRNEIARARRGLATSMPEEALWEELERLFLRAGPALQDQRAP